MVLRDVFFYDWNQPELASKRRAYLVRGWTRPCSGKAHAQADLVEADTVLTAILANNGVAPEAAARVKYSVLLFETAFLCEEFGAYGGTPNRCAKWVMLPNTATP
jgi:hypothetical protein